MYRVVLPALLLVLPGCSLGTSSLTSFGFNDASAATVASDSPRRSSSASLGGQPQTSRIQTAALNTDRQAVDKAPKGSFDKAPRGALADRDYSETRLEAEKARDVINAYRRQKGLKPLTLNAELTTAAKIHSRDLARWDRISHFGSDGSNPWDRVKRAGYSARIAAENVGTGQVTIEEVMKGWQASPSHNKNLLLPEAEHMGIALVQDPKTEFKTFWTLVVGSRS
jgi:uncharacterized protein YkwD